MGGESYLSQSESYSGVPGGSRTHDTRFRKPLLYPLSYGDLRVLRLPCSGVFGCDSAGRYEGKCVSEGRKTVLVVAACIVDGDRVLALERGHGDDAGFDEAGWWEFPGGKVKPGEELSDALHREIAEELSAAIDIREPIITIDHDYPAMHLRMTCFHCTLISGFHLKEHRLARWLTAGELDDVRWLPADVAALPTVGRLLRETFA